MPSTVEERNFYEAKWATTDRSRGGPRNYLVRKERFFLRQLRGRRGRVLDLGCGGGWLLFARSGEVVGVDLSLASLRQATSIYAAGVVADLGALPLADDSFDLVVSSDVLGHVPAADKDAVWREIFRVLRPGGVTVHYVEADGDDPLMRLAKRDGELFRRYVVEPEGHVGLESANRIAQRFRAAGFESLAEVPAYRGLTYLVRYVQYFDNEYAERSKALRALVAVCKLLIALRLELPANLALSAMIEFGDRVLPQSWAGGLLCCYRKPIAKGVAVAQGP